MSAGDSYEISDDPARIDRVLQRPARG